MAWRPPPPPGERAPTVATAGLDSLQKWQESTLQQIRMTVSEEIMSNIRGMDSNARRILIPTKLILALRYCIIASCCVASETSSINVLHVEY
jgi:hypothetical protein